MAHGWLDKLDNRAGHYLLLLICGASLFLVNLGGPSLWDLDEGRNATAAYEMMESGNWVVPTFNADLRVDKPALLYWLQIFAYRAFGMNEFAARLPSALAALLTLLVCYELGRSMFTRRAGLIAALVAATTPMICGAARFANPDSLLNLFTCLTLTVFWIGLPGRRAWWFIAVGASAGLAVLAKGPVGLVLPAGAALVFLLWTRQLGTLKTWRLALGVTAFLLVALPWYVWVGIETKSHFLRGFFLTHNVNRFLAPMESHSQGPWFYLAVLAAGLAPWSIFLGLAAWYGLWSVTDKPWPRLAETWRKTVDFAAPTGAAGQPTTHAYRFLWCWILLWVLFFSTAATKLPNYVLPTVLPVAVLIGRFWERWCAGEIALHALLLRVGLAGLAGGGLLLAAGFLIVGGAVPVSLAGPIVPALAGWAMLGLVPVIGGLAAWRFLRGNHRPAVLVCQLATAFVLLGALAGWAVIAFNAAKPARPLLELTGALDRDRELLLLGYKVGHLPSLHFYGQRDVLYCPAEQDVIDRLSYPVSVCLFTPAECWQQIEPKLTTRHRVLGRYPDLYRGGDVVVVTNQ